MTKRFLSILLVVIMSLSIQTGAFAAENNFESSNVTFVNSLGQAVTTLSTSEEITAKVNISNVSGSLKPTLLVLSYESGRLNGIWHNTLASGANSISVSFTPVTATANTVIKATVLGNLETLEKPSVMAQATKFSTDLTRISVNGKILEDYANDKDVYKMLINEGEEVDIDVVTADGGTEVTVTEATTTPGISTVKLVAANGTERNIDILTYNDAAQLTAPTRLAYKIGTDVIEIPLVEGKTEYDVQLPDNTFYATVVAETLSVANVSVSVQDINPHKSENSIIKSYAPGMFAGIVNSAFNERPAINNLIPIKNEETHAKVNVKFEDTKTTYTVKFKAKQPRLTEFNIAGISDTPSNQYLPWFISGAAVNNDNGTWGGSDRNYSISNVSEHLIGGSMFALSTKDFQSKGFIGTNTSGEIISFKADTKGTAYYFSSQGFTNTDELEVAGWESAKNVSNKNELLPTGVTAWSSLSKSYNSYGNDSEGNPKNAIVMHEWPKVDGVDSVADRYTKAGQDGTAASGGGYAYMNVYKKDFNAGDKVVIPHIGELTNRHMTEVIIVWDLNAE